MVTEAQPGAPSQETPKTIEQRMDTLESVMFELIDKVEDIAKQVTGVKKQTGTKAKGLFGGKRTPVPMKDLKTGKVYPSRAAVGKAFAVEAGGDQFNTMVYYTVVKVLKMPDGSDRFVPASPEEGAKARAEAQAKLEVEVAAANARLEAEQAAKDKAAAAPARAAKPTLKPQHKK